MTGKPITWDEIEAIFDRCGEVHVSRNLAQGMARKARRPKGSGPEGLPSPVAESDAPKGDAQ